MTETEALAWIAAVGSAVAAAGAWRTEATARWQALVERRRTDGARRENELHRRRFAEAWHFWHDDPDASDRLARVRWYYAWTGARPPLKPDADGPMPPGVGCANEDEAYERYVTNLAGRYGPTSVSRRPVADRLRMALRRRRGLRLPVTSPRPPEVELLPGADSPHQVPDGLDD